MIRSLVTLMLAALVAAAAAAEAPRKIILIAGNPSHGPGDHEHNAGVLLLQKCLKDIPGVTVEAHLNGWVGTDEALDGAAAVLVFSDGAGGHPILQDQRLERISGLMDKGVGLAMLHFATEIPADRGGPELRRWIGGYFETYWSVNPFWTADFKVIPEHPATRGVKPFAIEDEWYFHMRFAEGMKGVTPLLSAIPPDNLFREERGDRSGNPDIFKTKGQAHHVAWVCERPDGGRGFGFTGGHKHANWGDENFRKLVLNAILWIAKVEVPAKGVASSVTQDDLAANLDKKGGPPPPAPNAPAGDPNNKAVWKSDVLKKGSVDVDVKLDNAQQIWLVVTDGGDGTGCDWANWIEPRVETANGSIKLSDLKWTSATSGHAQPRAGLSVGGTPLLIDGKGYTEGIGTHARSVIAYQLPAAATRFTAKAALDDGGTSQGCGATVSFSIFTAEPPAAAFEAP
jgi:hypothetical protein